MQKRTSIAALSSAVPKPLIRIRSEALHGEWCGLEEPGRQAGSITAIVKQGATTRLGLMPPFHGLLGIRHDAGNHRGPGMRAAVRQGTKRCPVAPLDLPDRADGAGIEQFFHPANRRTPVLGQFTASAIPAFPAADAIRIASGSRAAIGFSVTIWMPCRATDSVTSAC